MKDGNALTIILDCYTVEPSGLGVPPYLSTYVRNAFCAAQKAFPNGRIVYVTIDDLRWCWNDGKPYLEAPLSDPLTYSSSVNRADAIQLIRDASCLIVIAGDTVPSVHLQAQNGSLEEIWRAVSITRGKRVLLGPLATDPELSKTKHDLIFDAIHSHTVTSKTLLKGSAVAAAYNELHADMGSYEDLIRQLNWECVAEIELYRGCTRRKFCSFCNEPVKNPIVNHRSVSDVLEEISTLYDAGVRNFRLGQQTCFFSYHGRDAEKIEALLDGIRTRCPDIEVLHIDNADPLAVASNLGKKIAKLVAQYCTEGNCAPMGMEGFDRRVIDQNLLTCTPEVLLKAISNINEYGAARGPLGFPKLLPGINIIYGLPGETHRTHYENMHGLINILERGLLCHRTNIRQARVYSGTKLSTLNQISSLLPSEEYFPSWKADLSAVYDQPMKEKVYPAGLHLRGLHSFFVTSRGTWFRRLGSYSIQVVARGIQEKLFEPASMQVTEHSSRYIYGELVG